MSNSRMSLEVILFIAKFFFKRPVSSILFYYMSLGYLVSGSWSLKQCPVWVPSGGVDLQSNQILVGYFHKHCATTALACHAGRRTPLQIKGSMAGLVFTFLL